MTNASERDDNEGLKFEELGGLIGVRAGGWPNFVLKATMGKVPGVTVVRLIGQNKSIQAATPAEVWNYGETSGAERYTSSTIADIDTISSSNAADTQMLIIIGLDSDFNQVILTPTLDGQNKVILSTPLIRFTTMWNAGSTDLAGNVYCYVDGDITNGVPDVVTTVRGYIENGDNQALMIQWTVPAGKTAYFYNIEFGLTSPPQGGAADFQAIFREYGGVFRSAATFAMTSDGTTYTQILSPIPNPFIQKTDFSILVDVSANGIGFSTTATFLVLDNEIWGLS